MRGLKILKRPIWVFYSQEDFDKCAPIPSGRCIGRDGFYYDRHTKACWIEHEGQSREYYADTFLHELEMLNHKPMTDIEIDAVETLIRMGKHRREYRYLLSREEHRRDLLECQRRSKLLRIQLLKEIAK